LRLGVFILADIGGGDVVEVDFVEEHAHQFGAVDFPICLADKPEAQAGTDAFHDENPGQDAADFFRQNVSRMGAVRSPFLANQYS
jgi:hypothetical protein